MIFGKHFKENIDIRINNIKLDTVHSTKFLGLIFDSKLTWKEQIESITKKVAKTIGIIARARQYLNKKNLTQLYFAFAYPYLTYGNIMWGSSPASTLWPLFKIQKIIVRMIGNLRKRDSTKMEFKTQKLLRLPDIYTYSACIFMFRYEKNLLPPPFHQFFRYNRDIHGHFTRSHNMIRQPRIRTKLAEKFITNMGPKLWNDIEGKVSNNNSLAVFKKLLLTWITNAYV